MKVLDERFITIHDLDGLHIDNIPKVLGALIPADAEDAKLKVSYDYSDIDVSIVYKREETPEEEIKRKEMQKRREATLREAAELSRQRELRELERLKKKYEST